MFLKASNVVRAVIYVQNIDDVSQGQKCSNISQGQKWSQSCYLCPEHW